MFLNVSKNKLELSMRQSAGAPRERWGRGGRTREEEEEEEEATMVAGVYSRCFEQVIISSEYE